MTLGIFVEHLGENPRFFFAVVITVVVSIVLHELAHGFSALQQGDDTPQRAGHITLNPIVHMGWMALIVLLLAGIAWGQTPVNPARFRSRHGDALVSFAGPAVNLVLAAIALTLLGLLVADPEDLGTAMRAQGLRYFLFVFGLTNLILFAFNLLPVPPFDGSHVLASFSPAYRAWTRNPANQPFFMIGLVLAIFFSGDLFQFAADVAARWVLAL